MEGAVDRGGLWWPARDRYQHLHAAADLADLEVALMHVPERGLALQAGGCTGVFPLHLARTFERVVTVEADAENFACLERNAGGEVECIHGALWGGPGPVGVARNGTNCGASRIDGAGDVPAVTIDGLALPRLDLIVLDVEGCELAALQGGRRTIAQCRPVIMFEERSHGLAYGVRFGAVEEWLRAEMGYALARCLRFDVIMVPGD